MFKKAKVVMLSTNQKAINYNQLALVEGELFKCSNEEIDNADLISGKLQGFPQQLYITYNQPKIGDWFLVELFDENDKGTIHLEKCNTIDDVWVNNSRYDLTRHIDNCKCVISSTDKTLGLPEPSLSFVEKYISEYNKGNMITDILVDFWDDSSYNPSMLPDIRVKINSKDNTITIKKVKDQFTKEEHLNKLRELAYYLMIENKDATIGDLNNWINENI